MDGLLTRDRQRKPHANENTHCTMAASPVNDGKTITNLAGA
jgi:hypothetical protein